jgi:hypothetical protein
MAVAMFLPKLGFSAIINIIFLSVIYIICNLFPKALIWIFNSLLYTPFGAVALATAPTLPIKG